MRLKLIDDWRRAHRFWSVRISAAGVAILAAINVFPPVLTVFATWLSVPPEVREQVPSWIAVAVIASIAGARLIQQKKTDDE